MNTKKIVLLIRIISAILIIFSVYLIIRWKLENNENKKIMNDILNDNNIIVEKSDVIDNIKIDYLKIDFENLLKYNEDCVGYIKIKNSEVNYPIVKSTNNDYYLTHNFYKNYNKAGWIFADYKNNMKTLDKNTIIYGHNRNEDTIMFGSLKNALSNEWCDNKENRYLYFSTIYDNYIGQIFSVYTAASNDINLKINFSSDSEYTDFLNLLKSKSFYSFDDVLVSSDDKILTLYTCDSNLSNRIIIHAKLIKL